MIAAQETVVDRKFILIQNQLANLHIFLIFVKF